MIRNNPMRTTETLRRGLFVAVLAGAMLMLAACGGAGEPELEKSYDMTAEEVAPNVYAVVSSSKGFPNEENRGWNSNMAFVVTDDGVLVFDTGTSDAIGESLKATIREVTDEPIRWVVNSHSHGDHWLGNAAVAGDDTTILASEETRGIIEDDGQSWVDRVAQMTDGTAGETTVLPPNETVTENETRELGGVTVEFRLLGTAHSPGDMALWLPEQEVLMAADVAYGNAAPATMDADVRHWMATLEELEALDPAVVIPGHGELGDARVLADLRGYLDTFWSAVETGFDRGQQDFQMRDDVEEALADYAERYPNFDDRVGESLSHIYLQVEQAAFGG